jgi:hypothetical protein
MRIAGCYLSCYFGAASSFEFPVTHRFVIIVHHLAGNQRDVRLTEPVAVSGVGILQPSSLVGSEVVNDEFDAGPQFGVRWASVSCGNQESAAILCVALGDFWEQTLDLLERVPERYRHLRPECPQTTACDLSSRRS